MKSTPPKKVDPDHLMKEKRTVRWSLANDARPDAYKSREKPK